ncbi:MAG: leucine-rich repeat protein [Lachnospiraceae bacterium]|nr:leucine-rich repeat protein [Lachnospiraceae bacterium]
MIKKMKKLYLWLFTMAVMVGTFVIIPQNVEAANTIVTSAGTLVSEDVTVTYDGKIHYPGITFTPAEGVDYSIKYYLNDDKVQELQSKYNGYVFAPLFNRNLTDEQKAEYKELAELTKQQLDEYIEMISADELPGYTNVGSYTVCAVLTANGTSNVSSTLTIESSGGSGGSGENDDPSEDDPSEDDPTEYTPEQGVQYVKEQYEQSFDNYDSLGSDKTFVIDCESYKIASGGEEYYELLNYFANDMYSDLQDEENDNYNFGLPTRFFLQDVDFDLDSSGEYVSKFKIIFKNNVGTKTDIEEKYGQIQSRISNIMSQYDNNVGVADYILLIHDGMCREIDFAYEDYKNGKGGTQDLHTADGVLANGKGLCDGYAYVFKYFMDKAGITCRVVYSKDLNHCWNMVKVSGYWFHVDVAWDDLVTSEPGFTDTFSNVADQLTMYGDANSDYNDIGWVSHAYYLKNDTQIKSLGYKTWTTYYPNDLAKQNDHPELGVNTQATVNGVYLDVKGAFSRVDGIWYNADSSGSSVEINKWNGLNDLSEKITMPVAVRYLTTDGKYLYYVSNDSIYRSLPDGSKTWKYTPLYNGVSYPITEFAYKNGCLVYVSTYFSTPLTKVNSDNIWVAFDDSAEEEFDPQDTPVVQPSNQEEKKNDTDNTQTPSQAPSSPALSEGNTTIDQTSTGGNDDVYDDVDEGEELTIGNAIYEVTETEESKEVAYTGAVEKNAKTVSVPDTVQIGNTTYNVTEISDSAFKANKKLTTVKIGKNVTTIGDSAFSSCSSLKTVIIGYNVETIGADAFKKDKALKKIIIPANVIKVDKNAFYQCTSLKLIQFKGKKVPTINKNAFKRINSKAVFKVPAKSLKQYKKKLTAKTGVTKKMKVKK